MPQETKTKKILVGTISILILLIGLFVGKSSGAFAFLESLVNGTYKNEVEELSSSGGNASGTAQFFNSKKCDFETTLLPTHKGVNFQEIAWMGDTKDTTNEWIIIEKESSEDIDISGWQIINKNERLKVVISQRKILSDDKQTYTLARHTKIEGQTPDLVFIGAIKNSNEGLRMFDSDCQLIDEVFASPNWPAGNNKSKKPMERLPDLSWRTKGEVVTSKIVTSNKETPEPLKCVNINTAPKQELIKIIHVGDKTADKIIELRNQKPFLSVDDLTAVRGIGTTTLLGIKKEGVACVE